MSKYINLISKLNLAIKNKQISTTVLLDRLTFNILDNLLKEGYLHSLGTYDLGTNQPKAKVKFKYHQDRCVLRSIVTISKPGKKKYWSYKKLKTFLYSKEGKKIILSTDKGVLNSTQALNEKVGGEALLEYF